MGKFWEFFFTSKIYFHVGGDVCLLPFVFVVVTAGFEQGSYLVGEGETVAVCVEVTSGVLGRDVLFNLVSNPGIIMHVEH